jgi:hypothetical protein
MGDAIVPTAFEARTFVHQTDRGKVTLSVPAPSVLVFDSLGFTDESFIGFIENVWDEQFGSMEIPVQVFADTTGHTGYTANFSTGMFQWSNRMIFRTDEYVILVESRWVAMGIAIVRSTLGLPGRHMEVSTKRDVFRKKRDAAIRRSLRRIS